MLMRYDFDASAALLEQVNHALNHAAPLRIQGGNSKAFLGRQVAGEVLDTRAHRGIVSYDPTELVITARAGTPLSELTFLSQGKRLELKALNIHTAEALASLDGGPLKMLGIGGREMKNQAAAYLAKAAGNADVFARQRLQRGTLRLQPIGL